MSEFLAAISKVEDRLAEILRAAPELLDQKILTSEESRPDEAVEPNTINIFTAAYQMDQSEEQGQTRHRATIEFERIGSLELVGTIGRENQRYMALIVQALAADRTAGGMIEDIQEVDVAPVAQNARDHGYVSLQCNVIFYTPRDDWFTISGIGGETF